MRTYEAALRLAPGRGGSVLRGTADMYVGMSALHRERGDLNAATQHLLRSQELGETHHRHQAQAQHYEADPGTAYRRRGRMGFR